MSLMGINGYLLPNSFISFPLFPFPLFILILFLSISLFPSSPSLLSSLTHVSFSLPLSHKETHTHSSPLSSLLTRIGWVRRWISSLSSSFFTLLCLNLSFSFNFRSCGSWIRRRRRGKEEREDLVDWAPCDLGFWGKSVVLCGVVCCWCFEFFLEP